jgi:hypothetical protein
MDPLPLLSALLLVAPPAGQAYLFEPAKVHVSVNAGLGFGGSVSSPDGLLQASFDESLVWSAALEVEVDPGWRFAALFSRQQTEIHPPRGYFRVFDLAVERYLVGIQEEKEAGPFWWFGTAWAGASRFIPQAPQLGSDTRFTAGLELGLKFFPSRRVGVRVQARGFYTVVDAEGGALCANGTCLFSFSGSGLWQGEVGGGLIFGF